MIACSLTLRKLLTTGSAILLCFLFHACKTVPDTETKMRAYLDQQGVKYYDVSLSPDDRFVLFLREDTEDIECLSGLPIGAIDISYSKVKDIRALTNCPIVGIIMYSNLVSDLSPLAETQLEMIWFSPRLTSNTVNCLRGMKSLYSINDATADNFWKMWDAGEHYESPSASPSRIIEETRKKKEEIERSWNAVPFFTNGVLEKRDERHD